MATSGNSFLLLPAYAATYLTSKELLGERERDTEEEREVFVAICIEFQFWRLSRTHIACLSSFFFMKTSRFSVFVYSIRTFVYGPVRQWRRRRRGQQQRKRSHSFADSLYNVSLCLHSCAFLFAGNCPNQKNRRPNDSDVGKSFSNKHNRLSPKTKCNFLSLPIANSHDWHFSHRNRNQIKLKWNKTINHWIGQFNISKSNFDVENHCNYCRWFGVCGFSCLVQFAWKFIQKPKTEFLNAGCRCLGCRCRVPTTIHSDRLVYLMVDWGRDGGGAVHLFIYISRW